MPLYEYLCKKCGHRFEEIRKFSDKELTKCPKCGGVIEQVISAPAVQFKGSGWYVTDYAKKGSGSSGSLPSSSSSESSSSESSSESSSDSRMSSEERKDTQSSKNAKDSQDSKDSKAGKKDDKGKSDSSAKKQKKN
jgi:putative FmdB family regulatory protein